MASLALAIGLISFLNRAEELIVPSWLAASITTGRALAFIVVTPRMLPIKQVLLTFAPETLAPIQITLLAVVTLPPAPAPKAVLVPPVVSRSNACTPTAVLKLPVVS